MKAKSLIAMTLAVAAVFTSCNKNDDGQDDIIWDISPVSFKFMACDAKGKDLLDPFDDSNKEFIMNTVVTYEGKDYRITDIEAVKDSILRKQTQTRMIPSVFRGLTLGKDIRTNSYAFSFGEFSGYDNFEGLTFVVKWPNGKDEKIEYWRALNYRDNDLDIKTTIRVNGFEVKETDFRHVF